MTRQPVSVLVPSFNNEDLIDACLQSVEWADEIVVCDSYSTDATTRIASRYADRVMQHEYVNSATQKNWALPQLSHAWVLIVDTDERVPLSLRREIEDALSHTDGFAGFRIPRANYVFGRLLCHGGYWPDYQIRLFQRDAGRYEGRQVHAGVNLDGPLGTLTAPFDHYPHRSLSSIRRTLLGRYTSWEAKQKLHDGVHFRPAQLVIRPAGGFFTRYIVRGGYRDGWRGLLMAAVWSCYVFITYAKLRSLQEERTP